MVINNIKESVYPRLVKNVLYINPIIHFEIGGHVKLGTGSMPNGDFRYIKFSRGYIGDNIEMKDAANYLEAKWSKQDLTVKDFYRTGSFGTRYVFYIRFEGDNLPDFTHYDCDIVNALKANEVVY